jgi:hypothetical protein
MLLFGKKTLRSTFISSGAIQMSSLIINTFAFSPTDIFRSGMDSGADEAMDLMASGK